MTELLEAAEANNEQLLMTVQGELAKLEEAIGEKDTDLNTRDFASLYERLEEVALHTTIFQSKEPRDISAADMLINRYVRATREFVITNPLGGDLLAADTEDSRNAFRIYLGVESAVTGDFETAKAMLVDVDGYQQESPLESALLARLEEAELESEVTQARISPEASATNMRNLGIRAGPETISTVEQADPHITIGTTVTVLRDMLEPGGRYMTTSELAIVTGAADAWRTEESRRGKINSPYNEHRGRAEKVLGHSSNPFTPKIVYGALTSDLQADRGSGYGRVIFHLKSDIVHDSSTTFTIGDSLPPDRGALEVAKVRNQQVTAEDALLAYASKLEADSLTQRTGLADNGNYVEAHVRGINFDKIDKVSVVVDRGKENNFSRNVEVVDQCLKNGIKTEVLIDPRSWSLERRVRERIESGTTEEEAVQETIGRLRSNFTLRDSPLFSIVFVVPHESEKEKNDYYRQENGYLNETPFVENGITIRHPLVGGRLLQTARRT